MNAWERPFGSLKALFTDNPGLKLLSLAIAIVAFSMVRGSEDAQRSVFVDVVAILPPAESGRMLVSDLPDQVRVTLKGSRSRINALRPDDLPPVQIDLSTTDVSNYYFTDEEFQIPTGLTITQLVPVSFELVWAERIEVEVPVVPSVTGALPDGLVLRGPVAVRPQRVRVVGPASEVGAMEAAATQELDLAGFTEGRHERELPLVRPPPHALYAQEAPARVSFEVVRELAERSFRGLEITPVGAAPRHVRPQRVVVTLRATPGELQALDPSRIVPFVELGELGPGHGAVSVPVQVRGLPLEVELVAIDPPEVLVTP